MDTGAPLHFGATLRKVFEYPAFPPDAVTLGSQPLRPVVSKAMAAMSKGSETKRCAKCPTEDVLVHDSSDVKR